MVNYAICSTPRVGSQLLGQLLTVTGRAGSPGEFFEPAVMADDLPRMGFRDFPSALRRIDDYVAALRRRYATPNGAFGVKLHTFQLQRAATSGFVLSSHLPRPRLIHLTRRDRVAQAVSFEKALQTRAWNAFMPSVRPPVYDRQRLAERVALIDRWDASWREVFVTERAPVLSLTYEDLVAHRVPALQRVARFLELDIPPAQFATLPAWFRRQSDGTSRDWIERYRRGE